MATNILNLGRVVGPGVPKGGKPGETIIKVSENDYDTKWGEGSTPGESSTPRPVGECKIFFRELTDLEMAASRLLKPVFQILLIDDYQELFDFFYCGDDQNDIAPWWYRCDSTGSRDIQGEYFRVISPEGLFPRFAGKNKVYGVNGKLVPEGNINDLNNLPYDGGAIGDFGSFITLGKAGIVPRGTTPRNLAHVLLGREVAGPQDVSRIINIISATIESGEINNIVIGDYFGLASINIPNGPSGQGAFFATLADIPGGDFGRNLDMVVVAKNPYLGKNGNMQPHVIVQPRNPLSAMAASNAGGHIMNATNTNVGGYQASQGRAFIINQVRSALIQSGIPFGDLSKIIPLSRRVANGGRSIATGADIITDNLFLLTEFEIAGSHTFSHPTHEAAATQAHFSEFFSNNISRIKRTLTTVTPVSYWLASPGGLSTHWCCVNEAGQTGEPPPSTTLGICPAFAIGAGDAFTGDGSGSGDRIGAISMSHYISY